MDAAIVTVGDELLAGDIDNTNATWLAEQLTDRGVSVRHIATVPDEPAPIGRVVERERTARDEVIVTGGLGGTPDDVTMAGIARAFDSTLAVSETALEDVRGTLERYHRERPDLELALDLEAEARIPEGSSPLLNDAGISPGCTIENVVALPGIPQEMRAMFDQVADRYTGDVFSRTVHTDRPESNIAPLLQRVGEEFDVSVGCYPDVDGGPKRIRVRAADPDRLDDATAFLADRL